MEITSKVLNYIKKHSLLKDNDSVICAVSGGADSVCMLDVLVNLKEELSLALYVVHLNHQLRGNEADRDEEFVRELSHKYGLPFYSKKVDVKRLAVEKKLSCEEAGRIARYDFLNQLKNELGAAKIATAHNKNDNVETVLMRVMRGTDIKGLAGIPVCNNLDVIRPVLCLKRTEIEEYLKCKGLDFVTDSTNLKDEFSRNKVRNNLIPAIEKQFNENFTDVMSSNIELFNEANNFIEKIVNTKFDLLADINRYCISFSVKSLLNEDSYIVKRIIKKAVNTLENISISNNLCELIYRSLSTGSAVCINDNLNFYVKYNTAYFFKKHKIADFSCTIDKVGNYFIPELSLNLTVEENTGPINFSDKNTLYLDTDKVSLDFCLRGRQNGDKMSLLNCGNKKIKDILIDEKIPSFLRDEIPVLEYNGEIIWLCGVRDNGSLRAKSDNKYIKISLHKENYNE